MAFDFPPSPFTGQVYAGWTYDGEKWLSTTATPNTAGVIAIQVFTASGIYVPTASMTTCVIECVGGGGGGGGALVASTTQLFTGSGGGGGGYSRKYATATGIGASATVTVGAAGAGGAAGANNGGAGGATSVGTLCVAAAGLGGTYGSVTQVPSGTSGGSAGSGTGDVTTSGGPGLAGVYLNANTPILSSGAGGSSALSGGAVSITANASANNGFTATGYGGGGGGGAASFIASGSAAGGNGAKGIVIITEYGMTALASTAGQGNVRYDLPQGLSLNQMAQARANIGSLKRNYIINGAMQISQENGAAAGTAEGYFAVDQFSISGATSGTRSLQQIASVTPAGSPNRIRCTVTVADAAVAAGDYVFVYQIVEGLRIADLKSGSVSAKTITVQFGVKAPAGTYSVTIKNATRAYVAEYIISAGEANTDVTKSVTLTLDQTGTWATDNTIGFYVMWTLMCGSTFQTAAGSWVAGNLFGSSNQYNFMGTINNVFELFDVGLYEGTVAPAFQVPDYANELALCKRYWCKTNQSIGCGYSTVAVRFDSLLPVTMRISPTLSIPPGPLQITDIYTNNFTQSTNSDNNFYTATADHVMVNSGSYTGITPGRMYYILPTSPSIGFNARL